jgi:hypothetical protein
MVYKPLRRKRSVGASKESEAPATPASKSSRLVVISDASFFLHERGAAESLVPKAITNLRPRLLREYGVQLDAEPRRAAAADHLTYEFGSSTAAPGILLVCLQGFAHCGPDSWGSDAVVKAIEQAVERALRAMPTKPDTGTGGAATECPTEQDCPFVDRHQRAWRMHAPSVGRSLAKMICRLEDQSLLVHTSKAVSFDLDAHNKAAVAAAGGVDPPASEAATQAAAETAARQRAAAIRLALQNPTSSQQAAAAGVSAESETDPVPELARALGEALAVSLRTRNGPKCKIHRVGANFGPTLGL